MCLMIFLSSFKWADTSVSNHTRANKFSPLRQLRVVPLLELIASIGQHYNKLLVPTPRELLSIADEKT